MKTINIKGKAYVQVNERVKALRSEKAFEGYAIDTMIHELTDDVCVMCARVKNAAGNVVATGWAREVRNDATSMVNKTSYVENCETSAVGRALGFLGIGIDENICSAEELQYALQAQEAAQPVRPKTAAPTAAPKLTERELDECDDAMSKMDFAQNRTELVAIYNRYRDAAFASKLQEHGAQICAQKGWKVA